MHPTKLIKKNREFDNYFGANNCTLQIDEYKEINDKFGKFGQKETSFIVTSFINNPSIDLSKK